MKEESINLKFDNGTLVSKKCVDTTDESEFQWDARTKNFRAPARAYAKFKDHFDVKNFADSKIKTPLNFSFKHELRPYQIEALQAWKDNNFAGIVCLPTGAGKTKVALAAMAKLKIPTLCLVPTKILAHQWIKEIKEVYSGPVGLYGDGEHHLELITVASFESAYRHMKSFGQKFKFLIIDEVHHFGLSKRDITLDMSIAEYRLGLTATIPDLDRLKSLEKLIGPLVYTKKIEDLKGKYLADFDHFTIGVNLSSADRSVYEEAMGYFKHYKLTFERDYGQFDWQSFVKKSYQSKEGKRAFACLKKAQKIALFNDEKLRCLKKILLQHPSKKIIIFVPQNEAAYTIAKCFFIAPITSDIGRKERAQILENFKSGKITRIVSCKVLNEGFDIPTAEIAVILGGSGIQREQIQRIGRVLRPFLGKKALIYEIVSKDTLDERRSDRRNQ